MSPQVAKQVLLVEDDVVMADVLQRSLQVAGFGVTVARSGLQADELCREESFDAVVTDYQMPKMNGEEFVRRLRQGSANAHVPVIFVTGKSLELDTEQLRREMNVFEFISKPFGPRHLIGVVQRCLGQEPAAVVRWSTES